MKKFKVLLVILVISASLAIIMAGCKPSPYKDTNKPYDSRDLFEKPQK
ncbi:MAG: hypothetical protein WCX17_02425 [Parcubacteria group bacterium]|jgi:hypothetical protein